MTFKNCPTKENLSQRQPLTNERIALLRAAVGTKIWTETQFGALSSYMLVAVSADGETCFIESVHRSKGGHLGADFYQIPSRRIYFDSETRQQ